VQGSNGYSFLPLQAYEIMCMRGEGLQLGFTTDPRKLKAMTIPATTTKAIALFTCVLIDE
ncbi:MAG: hypothetical protein KH425_00995, partial [Prevotella bivia]|nr:hypothetical protein [Prevotella bivia]MDU2114240.1 hypothetical protein [Prevotella bivia]